MADLSMKQRQTFPYVVGSATDAEGLLLLHDAEQLTVWIELADSSELYELPAVAINPPVAFKDRNGEERLANFQAPIATSGLTDAVADDLRGVLEVLWNEAENLRQFVPQEGFMTFVVTENVKAPTP